MSGAALAVEEEEVEHQVFACLADQREHRIEDLLAHHRRAEHVGTRHIRQEMQLGQRRVDDFAAHAHAVGQRLEEIPERDHEPEQRENHRKTAVPDAACEAAPSVGETGRSGISSGSSAIQRF